MKKPSEMSAYDLIKYLNGRRGWHGKHYRSLCGAWLKKQEGENLTCPECGGTGRVSTEAMARRGDEGFKCDRCDGSGIAIDGGGSPLPRPICSDSKTLVSEGTFRSSGKGVNESDNMVRATIDMPLREWRAWKRKIFLPNAEVDNDI